MTDLNQAAPSRFLWTPEMDAALADGFSKGQSARLIAESLGVTRNSVLGRTFRLGLCNTYTNPRKPTSTAQKPKRISLAETSNQLKVIPAEIVERIVDLREIGATWAAIASVIGVSLPTVRSWAIKFGYLTPKMLRRFSEAEDAYILDAWNKNVPLEDIAEKLDRSFGVIHQRIFRLRNKGVIGTRDAAKTRLLKQYGEAALSAGATPTEALVKMRQAKQFAFASAVQAATAAKRQRYDEALAIMREAILIDRDAAIFAARAEGVTLEEIGKEIGVTRERVRQICNAHAQLIALRGVGVMKITFEKLSGPRSGGGGHKGRSFDGIHRYAPSNSISIDPPPPSERGEAPIKLGKILENLFLFVATGLGIAVAGFVCLLVELH